MIRESMLRDNEYLISRFETGDKPTGRDFKELIESKASLSEVYSREEVDGLIAGITGVDISNLASKEELVSALSTKAELNHTHEGFAKETHSHVEYAEIIHEHEDLAKATEVDEALDIIEAKIPDITELTKKVQTLEETVADLLQRIEALENA